MKRLRCWSCWVGARAADGLCPIIILAMVIDAAGAVAWTEYTGRDMQIYTTIARFWRDGFIPYRDLYDFKPPLMFAALRVGYALWGYEPESFQRVTLILTAMGALTMYAGLRRGGLLLAAPLTALGFVTLVVADPGHVVSPNTELLAAAFGAAAFGCAAACQGGGGGRWAVASGVCVALATLSKQPAILWALPVGAQLWLGEMRGSGPHRLRPVMTRMLLAGVGFGAIVGLLVGYFAWHGAATALYEAVLVDGSRYAGLGKDAWTSLPWRPTRQLLYDIVGGVGMWPFAAAMAMLVPLTVLRPSRWSAAIWLWLLTSYFVVVVGPRSEWHYTMASFPALAASVGMAFELAVGREPARHATEAAKRLAGAVLIAVVVFGGIWRADYLPRRRTVTGLGPEESQIRGLGLKIRGAATSGDTLLVKDEPFHIYMYAGMAPMTRFVYPDSPAPNAVEVWASALERSPTFIVIDYGTAERLPRAKEGLEGTLAQLLSEHYELWLRHPNALVYRRCAEAPSSTPLMPMQGLMPPDGSSLLSSPLGMCAVACGGDCNRDGHVTVREILTAANIILGNAPASTCAAGDTNYDGQITIDEMLAAVHNALHGCDANRP